MIIKSLIKEFYKRIRNTEEKNNNTNISMPKKINGKYIFETEEYYLLIFDYIECYSVKERSLNGSWSISWFANSISIWWYENCNLKVSRNQSLLDIMINVGIELSYVIALLLGPILVISNEMSIGKKKY